MQTIIYLILIVLTPTIPKLILMKIHSPQILLVNEIQDLYSAEQQILKAMPKMIEAAQDWEIKDALEMHQQETEGQVERLKEIASELGVEKLEGKFCHGMEGILKEGEESLMETENPSALELALLCGGEKVENYEIVGYQNAMMLADQLNYKNTAKLLNESLKEEKNAALKFQDFSRESLRALS